MRATGIDVQQGATQRSFIRAVDVLFNSEVGLNSLLATGRVAVERFAPNATNVALGTGIRVNDFRVERIRDRLRLDFDIDGITSELGIPNPTNSPVGDGFYRVMVDMNGDGDFTDQGIDSFYHFHRLLETPMGMGKSRVFLQLQPIPKISPLLPTSLTGQAKTWMGISTVMESSTLRIESALFSDECQCQIRRCFACATGRLRETRYPRLRLMAVRMPKPHYLTYVERE